MIELLKNFISVHGMDQPDELDLSYLDDLNFHLYCKDRQATSLWCNNRLAKDLGLKSPSDYVGLTAYDLSRLTGVSEETALMMRKNNFKVMETGKSLFFIETLDLSDGTKLTSFSHKAPLRARYSKKVIGMIGLAMIVNEKDNLFFPVTQSHNDSLAATLTARQLDCLFYLVKGMTIKQIAQKLNLSPRTVEHYIDTIKGKLNCYSRDELVTKALQLQSIKNALLKI